ncbi:MAG: hypothetical protein CL402_00775 [Acidiferrobacteraceae bacterium]|nr:hypothetical protein [Acidiferrobacteraceae bacterium]
MSNYTENDILILLERANLSSLNSEAESIAHDLNERSKLNETLSELLRCSDKKIHFKVSET